MRAKLNATRNFSQQHAYLSVSAVMFSNNFLVYTVHIDRSVFLYYP